MLFYFGAVLSFVSLWVNQKESPHAYTWILSLFAIAVLALFVTGMVTRLYFTPRAERKRRQDFLTQAFGVSLTYENTVGYYNNDFADSAKKLAAQVLENSFFTKQLALKVAHRERIKVTVYFLLWFICLLNRNTEFGVILAATQAVFSEQIVSRAIRLEWLRGKCEQVHDDVYRLFQSNVSDQRFLPMAIDSLLLYETAKSNAAIVMPSKLFHRLNGDFSAEWGSIRERLKIN
jgi:hypothetical protein